MKALLLGWTIGRVMLCDRECQKRCCWVVADGGVAAALQGRGKEESTSSKVMAAVGW